MFLFAGNTAPYYYGAMNEFHILTTKSEKDYELIDSGEGEKLERYGDITVSRPDPQALWKKHLGDEIWQKAQAQFSRTSEKGEWNIKKGVPEKWAIDFAGLTFNIKPTAFKHTGIFPEQSPNWKWIGDTLAAAKKQGREKISVLNIFGYTGGATLAAAKAGAEVVHLDGSKSAITWARENAELSGLRDAPIRWIVDDAQTFVEREIRRGNSYDAIIMDPPAFGRGPKGEIWKIEEHLLGFLNTCGKLLSDKPVFFLINGYASGYSALVYKNSMADEIKFYGGRIEIGELTIQESSGERLLPAGIFGRWQSHL